MMAGVWAGAIIGVVANIGADLLADTDFKGLAAVMTDLEFAFPGPREECISFS